MNIITNIITVSKLMIDRNMQLVNITKHFELCIPNGGHHVKDIID